MKREEAQKQAEQILEYSNTVLLQLPTGYGKTALSLKLSIGKKILGIVPQINMLDNFQKDKEKLNINCGKIETICNASIQKYKNTKWDTIILDECDTITKRMLNVLKTIQYDRLILASAYVSEKKETLIKELGGDIRTTVSCTIEEAIKSEVIPPFKLYVHKVKLKTEKDITIEYLHKATNTRRSFVTSELEQYNYYNDLANRLVTKYRILNKDLPESQQINVSKLAYNYAYRQQFSSEHKTAGYNLNKYWKKRQEIIYNSKNKFKKALELYNKTKRQIFFFNDQINANLFGEKIGVKAYHSKNKAKENSFILDEFNNGITSTVDAVKAMNRGLSLFNIEEVTVVQLGNSKTEFTQRFGRGLRWIPGVVKTMHCIIVENTQDETWFKNANVIDQKRIYEISK